MARMIQSIRKINTNITAALNRLAHSHPYLTSVSLLIGMPLAALCTVFVCTTIVLMPIAVFFFFFLP